MDSSEASARAGLTSALGCNDTVESVGFEWDWGVSTTCDFGEMEAGLALGLDLIK